jgi:hypothetical protein
MLARCPSCRNTFSAERSGRQECPVCGKPLYVPEPEPVSAQAEIPTEPEGTPWERRAQLGLWSGWLQTMQGALLEPGKLFASARLDRGAAQLGFAVLTCSAASVLEQAFGLVLSGSQQAMVRRMLENLPADSPALPMLRWAVEASRPGALRFLLHVALAPLFWLVFVYLNAAVTHAVAALLGQSRRGFAATFTACAYGCAPLVLMAVPACGGIIGLVWLVVLTGIGMKITHGISSGGATATVVVPYLACCCLGTAATFLMISTLGHLGGP